MNAYNDIAKEDYSFADFANIMIGDNTIASDSHEIYNIKELYDGYIKHLMVRKYKHEDILRYRMEAVVDYYLDFYGSNKNYDRSKLVAQYKNSITDCFDKKLNPPKCFLTIARREDIANELKEKMEYESCDINTHYKMINMKYEYYGELNNSEKQKQSAIENDEYYDECNDYYNEDELNSSICNSDDYDDYYCGECISEDDSEYYSDDY
uniref:Uncharacterized protein n=1 Tax=viral metagenome TaxID=1070528 RepID=A0A6C0LCY3_9ZZZZ